MQTQPLTFGLVVRRGIALAILGILLVAFAGPAAVVAGFAALGYVAYRGFRFLWFGEKPPEWGRVAEIGGSVFRGLWTVVSWPAARLWAGVKGIGGFASSAIGGVWSLTGETLGGALLGAALGVAVGWPLGLDHFLVALGAGGGALVGLWIGVENIRRARNLAARQAALEASLS
jgi:hypothetical protein